MTTFNDLGLIQPLLRAVEDEGYTQPTPIQIRAIPPLLDDCDVLGCAQTGTGKTAAFALPVLQHMAEDPVRGKRYIRALILSPTRELAAQIGDSFQVYAKYLDIRHLTVFGGVNQRPQVAALRRGIDVLVATPGRLLDLQGQGHIDFGDVEFFVLDEADRMLDMGFIHDIRKVLALLPSERQNLLFSATMPDNIVKLAGSFLYRPVHVEVTPQVMTVEAIEQSVMFVERSDKRRLLADLYTNLNVERAIVFTRTKHGANRLVKQLDRAGISAAAIHGNKSQNARNRAMAGFKTGEIPLLVATDIASRGIDVEGVTHVFNYDLPNEPEVYVHRIGRTGRAGRTGVAVSFCDQTEGAYLRDIEKLTGQRIPVVEDHDYHFPEAVPPPLGARQIRYNRSAQNQGRGRGSGGSSGRGGSRRSTRGGQSGRGGASEDSRRRSGGDRFESQDGAQRRRPKSDDSTARQRSGSDSTSRSDRPRLRSADDAQPSRRRRRRRRPQGQPGQGSSAQSNAQPRSGQRTGGDRPAGQAEPPRRRRRRGGGSGGGGQSGSGNV